MKTAVLLFTAALPCGHSKMIKRKVEEDMPTKGLFVTCLRCSDTSGSGRIMLKPVMAVEIFGAGLE